MMQRLRFLGCKWQAMLLLVLGRRQAALAMFHRMRGEFPGHPYPIASAAHVQAQLGDTAGALASMADVVAVEPGNGSHWFNYGYLLESAARYEEAEAAFRRATELRPELDRAWYGLGPVSYTHLTLPTN